jgi:hypothetical protein
MVEVTTSRWTFERGMREVTREALVLLWHEMEEQMEQWQYHHFLSHVWEGAEAVVMPAGDLDHIGCFIAQVKLTHALIWDLNETIKKVNLRGGVTSRHMQLVSNHTSACACAIFIISHTGSCTDVRAHAAGVHLRVGGDKGNFFIQAEARLRVAWPSTSNYRDRPVPRVQERLAHVCFILLHLSWFCLVTHHLVKPPPLLL